MSVLEFKRHEQEQEGLAAIRQDTLDLVWGLAKRHGGYSGRPLMPEYYLIYSGGPDQDLVTVFGLDHEAVATIKAPDQLADYADPAGPDTIDHDFDYVLALVNAGNPTIRDMVVNQERYIIDDCTAFDTQTGLLWTRYAMAQCGKEISPYEYGESAIPFELCRVEMHRFNLHQGQVWRVPTPDELCSFDPPTDHPDYYCASDEIIETQKTAFFWSSWSMPTDLGHKGVAVDLLAKNKRPVVMDIGARAYLRMVQGPYPS